MNVLDFRAWYKNKEYVSVISVHMNGEVTLQNGIKAYWKGQFKDSDLEQFTGKKDKNGIKIYKGDICNFYCTKYWTRGMEYGWQVAYTQCNFCFRTVPDNGSNYWIGSPAIKEIEVVGNIHD